MTVAKPPPVPITSIWSRHDKSLRRRRAVSWRVRRTLPQLGVGHNALLRRSRRRETPGPGNRRVLGFLNSRSAFAAVTSSARGAMLATPLRRQAHSAIAFIPDCVAGRVWSAAVE